MTEIIRNLVEEQENGCKEELMKIKDLLLVIVPYNVRRDRNTRNAEYRDVLSSHMKYMSEVLGKMIKQEAHEHGSCSIL